MKHKGFTLIELMIVVAIVAILARIAYPSYTSYISKSRRTDAKSALMSVAQGMEKFYTEKMSYDAAALGSGSGDVATTSSQNNYYTIAFDSAPASTSVCAATATTSSSASAFRICATPTGTQANDSCSILSIDSKGIKTPTTSGCW